MTSRKQLIHHLGEFDRLAREPVERQLAWAAQVRPLFLALRDPLLKARYLLKVGSLGDTLLPPQQLSEDLLLAQRIFLANGMELDAARCLARLAYWYNRRGLPMSAVLAGRMALTHDGLPLAERMQLVTPMCLALAAQRQLPAAWSLLDELAAPIRKGPGDRRIQARLDGIGASLHFIEALRARRLASLYCVDLLPGEPDLAASERQLQACEQRLQAYEGTGLSSQASIALRAMTCALRGDSQGVQARLGLPDPGRQTDALSQAVQLYNLGWCWRVLGCIDLAQAACRQSLQRLGSFQHQRVLLQVHYELSLCAQAACDPGGAHAHLSDFVHLNAHLATSDLEAAQALVAQTNASVQAMATPPGLRAAASAPSAPSAHLRATEPACLARAEKLLIERLPRRQPLTSLATQVGVSLRTLQAAAQSYRGMTLSEMLRQRVMAEARRLLRDTDLSLREIAARCGHRDPSAFSRDFKRVYGSAPSVHRTMLASARPPAAAAPPSRHPQGWD